MDLKPILSLLEQAVKAEIEKGLDQQVDLVLQKLAEIIPGKIDDMVIAQVSPAVKKAVKEELLKLVDKIDGQVN